jgi:hypothetical protein
MKILKPARVLKLMLTIYGSNITYDVSIDKISGSHKQPTVLKY